jgi:long-chain acyl-CoA synthetase
MNRSHLIHHFLEKSAKRFPNKTALVHDEVRATYARINAAANQVAARLLDLEFTQGDRVVLILKNCFEYVSSYYGILKAGGVVAAVSSDIKPDDLMRLLKELDAKVIISSFRFERLLKAVDLNALNLKALMLIDPKLKWNAFAFSVFSWEDLISERKVSNPNLFIEGSDLAAIVYTSGSTGKPRGVMLSHQNIVSNTVAICRYLQLTDQDIQMAVLPFCYVMGKSLLNTHFAVGGTVVVNNTFAYPATVVSQMVDEAITGFSGVPSTYAYLLHRSPLADYKDKLPSLRYCSQAGGHLSRTLKEKLRKTLPDHTRIFIMYGATEAAARLTYLPPDRFYDKMESIGKPIDNVSLRVKDSLDREVPLGQVGELVARGSNIMQGYWKDAPATAEVLKGNEYHTGDLGFQDEEGCFYVIGRKDDLLKVGGYRINPLEIEDAILDTQLAVEAAVIGVADELLGCRLMALVTPVNEDCKEKQILGCCSERLPKYKLPSEIRMVRALPKNASGKIDRMKILKMIGG